MSIAVSRASSPYAPDRFASRASVPVPLGLHRSPRHGIEFRDMPRRGVEPLYTVADYAAMLDYMVDAVDAVSCANGVSELWALTDTLARMPGWRILAAHRRAIVACVKEG